MKRESLMNQGAPDLSQGNVSDVDASESPASIKNLLDNEGYRRRVSDGMRMKNSYVALDTSEEGRRKRNASAEALHDLFGRCSDRS